MVTLYTSEPKSGWGEGGRRRLCAGKDDGMVLFGLKRNGDRAACLHPSHGGPIVDTRDSSVPTISCCITMSEMHTFILSPDIDFV